MSFLYLNSKKVFSPVVSFGCKTWPGNFRGHRYIMYKNRVLRKIYILNKEKKLKGKY
jgi:hypothetical protein